jgi:TetR/AcrR family transcriptional regulator, cholesterol catabolism regulator
MQAGTAEAEAVPTRVRREVLDRRRAILDALVTDAAPSARTDTRRQVVEAAIGLFGRKGFEACTMRDLAGAAGVKAPALYNHFSSKEQVLAEAIEHALGQFFRHVLDPLPDEDPAAWLEGIVRRHTLFQIEQVELALANDLILSWEHRDSHLSAADAQRIRGLQADYLLIVRSLARVRARPRARKERLVVAAFAIIAICDRSNTWYRPSGSLSPDQVAQTNWELVAGVVAAI